MIVTLLVGSMCAQFILLHAALSDGGAQVEPDYYARAVDWDAYAKREGASERLGWTAQLELRGAVGALTVSDRDGAPLEGVEGKAILTRPHISGGGIERELEPGSGALLFALPEGTRGLWDVKLELKGARGERFTQTLRSEW